MHSLDVHTGFIRQLYSTSVWLTLCWHS